MAFKMKGAPMHRNFKIGKPGPPSTTDTETTEVDNGTTSWVDKDGKDKKQNTTATTKSSDLVGENSKGTDLNLGYTAPKTNDTKENTGGEEKKYKDDGTKTGKEGENKVANFMNKPILQVLGLTKKQREARKIKKDAKRDAKLSNATTAVEEGTETLKQAKTVERNRKKTDRKTKSDIKKAKKDKKKLVKYREKNPVRGKEAINLLASQTKKL
tara:strand:+ start:38 stop:676 length:639 start_codon:yes stop_codon:yes gene_type:complete